MNHLTEEDLILHYYGEKDDAPTHELHLDQCEECRALYGSLQRALNTVEGLAVPERGPEYGDQVWQSIARDVASARRARWPLQAPWRWAAAVALLSLVGVAFLAGRHFPVTPEPAVVATDGQAGERVLMVAIGDYLERSQGVLVELSNASPDGNLDISMEQSRAADLVSENRLYRQTALYTGQPGVANVLEELERALLDIAHAPSDISPRELEELRQRLEAQGILFKIRVLGSNVRSKEEPGTHQRL
jgi:predicted anti-sigma-YlaC factor YlaD